MSSAKVVEFTIKQLLESGAHFGHRTNYWNPKMAQYIYGTKDKVHIIDLRATAIMLNRALGALKQAAANNGRILFVGTKKQASDVIAEQAKRCGQYYVNYRWLGGMMTNWTTISASIKTLEHYEEMLGNENLNITKKERLELERKYTKLLRVLGGIRNLGGKPDLIFVIDSRRESLAMQEARKLGIPVVAIVDTNANPDNIDYVVPGNDDARKAIELYTTLASEAVLKGIGESLQKSGADLSVMSTEEVIKLNQESKAAKADKKAEHSDAKTAAKKPAKKADGVEGEEAKAKPAAKTAEAGKVTVVKKSTEKKSVGSAAEAEGKDAAKAATSVSAKATKAAEDTKVTASKSSAKTAKAPASKEAAPKAGAKAAKPAADKKATK